MKGKCLCGEVRFSIDDQYSHIYQCHCSLCRQVSGSSSNSSLIVAQEHFHWLCGVSLISSFVKSTGYRSDFCSRCGCPAPNSMKNGNDIWVPVGLLYEHKPLKVVAHLCTESKAQWDTISEHGAQFKSMPELRDLYHVLDDK